MHHEMIQPTHFGVIGRTCLLSLVSDYCCQRHEPDLSRQF